MERILVIDDEKNVLDMINRALSKNTYVVETYSSPRDGLAALERFNPDVVITDIKMEELNGFEVLKKVKTINPEINVILITAYASVDTAVEALRSGAFDYLIKPFKINDLRIAVKRALSEKKISHGIEKDVLHAKEMIEAGVPLVQALDILTRNNHS